MSLRAWASLAFVAMASCAAEPTTTAGCPGGSDADRDRSARLIRLLGPDTVAAARVGRVRPTICFGTGAPGLGGLVAPEARGRAGGAMRPPVALLDVTAPDAELAARLAHLVRHAEEPPLERSGGVDVVSCSRAVVRAARVEALATLEEVEIRRRLGLGSRAPEEDVVRGYLGRCRDGW